MRELYAQLPEKPDWISLDIINAYARRMAVPGKFQCAIEMLVEFVNDQAKTLVHGDRSYIAPLALTVFIWVTLMNCIDLLPVDLIPMIAGWLGFEHMRPLATADLNGPYGDRGI